MGENTVPREDDGVPCECCGHDVVDEHDTRSNPRECLVCDCGQPLTVQAHGIAARYRGGEYVDLCDPDTGAAYDVVNVWDYQAGKPRIPRTAEAVTAELDRLARDGDERLHWWRY